MAEGLLWLVQTTTEANSRKRIEAVVQTCSAKRLLWKISQNSQENTCASLFFNKVAGLWPFPVNFVKFLRTPFSIEHLWWLLLREELNFSKHWIQDWMTQYNVSLHNPNKRWIELNWIALFHVDKKIQAVSLDRITKYMSMKIASSE